MEAIEYAARAIARDVEAALQCEDAKLGDDDGGGLFDQVVKIARSHITTFLHTLPRTEDVLPFACDPAAAVVCEDEYPDNSKILKEILLDSCGPEPAKLSKAVSLNSATTTLDRLIRDLTLTVEPRSASYSFPHPYQEDPANSPASTTVDSTGSPSMLRSSSANITCLADRSRGRIPTVEEHATAPPVETPPEKPKKKVAARGGRRRHRSNGEGEVWADDHHRMVFVSWIPRQLRVQSGGEKRRAEVTLKNLLRTELQLEGLSKVLLFPPKGTHCKLVFETAHHAAKFMSKYGGQFGSALSEKWKAEICEACRLEMNDHAFATTTVTIEWAQPHFT